MTKIEKALKTFNDGFNCAQAIFSTYGTDLGIDRNTALKISTGFGAGMARLQETCGALTGAYMVIGLKYGKTDANDKTSHEKIYKIINEMTSRFKERNKSTLCKDLLGQDLNTVEGKTYIEENGLFATVCCKCVEDAARILEELIIEDC